MRFEDDYEQLSKKLQKRGVSPAWRVVGIISSVAAGLLLLTSIGLGIALVAQTAEFDSDPMQNWQPGPGFPNQPAQVNFPNFNGGGDDDPDPEPPNPPYPTVADLQTAEQKARLGMLPNKDKPSAHDRFVTLGQRIWSPLDEGFPLQLSLSPDGKQIAYVNRQVLYVGAIDGEVLPLPNFTGAMMLRAPRVGTPVGSPAWSQDSRVLLFADSEGKIVQCEVSPARSLQTLDFVGECPLPMATDGSKVIYRRSRAVAKFEGDGGRQDRDPTEIVVRDLPTRKTRVLIPGHRVHGTPVAVSPNGKWLLLSSNRGVETKRYGHVRLYLLSLDGDKPPEPQAIGPEIPGDVLVCWEPDSAGFLYSRGQEPAPADCFETGNQGFHNDSDLFRFDVKLSRETRISRGGGFTAPLLDGNGNLLFFKWKSDPDGSRVQLHRAPWPAVLKFAASEPNPPPRGPAEWNKLFEAVLRDASVPPDVRGEQLPAEATAKIADAFVKHWREQLKTEPPTDDESWRRVRRELSSSESAAVGLRSRALIVGACEGEILRRKHGAVWRLSSGSLRHSRFVYGETQDSPFAYVFNPFDSAATGRDEDDDGDGPHGLGWMDFALEQARGRTIILTNNYAEGVKAAKELADPKLDRALDLFKMNQGDEAERLLLDMVKPKKHERNDELVVHVGRILYENRRFAALRPLLEAPVQRKPDPSKYNLLGLALLEDDPRAAVEQFKIALRYNLNFGAAYLNLAQAYQKIEEIESARWCLKRCIKLMPFSASGQDARNRLAALNGRVE